MLPPSGGATTGSQGGLKPEGLWPPSPLLFAREPPVIRTEPPVIRPDSPVIRTQRPFIPGLFFSKKNGLKFENLAQKNEI